MFKERAQKSLHRRKSILKHDAQTNHNKNPHDNLSLAMKQ